MQYKEYITQKVFIKVYEDGTIKGTVKGNPAYGRKWMNNKYYKIYAKPEWIEKLIEKGFEFGYEKTLPKYDLSNII